MKIEVKFEKPYLLCVCCVFIAMFLPLFRASGGRFGTNFCLTVDATETPLNSSIFNLNYDSFELIYIGRFIQHNVWQIPFLGSQCRILYDVLKG